jgi:hypothetical protein
MTWGITRTAVIGLRRRAGLEAFHGAKFAERPFYEVG